jgi:hypothetical protein
MSYLLFRKISILVFLPVLFLNTSFAQSSLPQQIKIRTDETIKLGNGQCKMYLNADTIYGTVTDGVCTIPDGSSPNSNLPTIEVNNNGIATSCEFNNLTKIFCNKDLADIIGLKVSAQVKDVVVATQLVGFTIFLSSLASPLFLGITSPHLFLSALFVIFGIRKKKPWGLVYDAKTFSPIVFAVVKLVDPITKKFVKDAVTDTNGRFSFLADKGNYYIQVKTLDHRDLPMLNKKLDSDIYSGEIIELQEDNANITVKIPIISRLGGITLWERFRQNIRSKLPRVIRRLVLILLILSIITFVVESSIVNLFPIIAYLTLYLFILRNKQVYSNSYGYIYKILSNNPVSHAFVKLYNPLTKALATDLVLTDEKGRFVLLADKGKYELMIEATDGVSIKEVEGDASLLSANTMNVDYGTKFRVQVGVE